MALTLLRFALRGVRRQLRASIFVVLSVAAGVSVLVFLRAVQDGYVYRRLDAGLGLAVGHLRVAAPEGAELDGARVAAALARDPDVLGAAPRVRFEGFVKGFDSSRGVLGYGVDADLESRTLRLPQHMVEGAFLPAVDARDVPPVAMGRALAAQLGCVLDERVALLVEGRDGALVARTFRVAGLFDTGNAAFDGRAVYVPRDAADAMLLPAGDATEVVARLRDPRDAPAVALRLAQSPELAGLTVQSWHVTSPEILEAMEVIRALAVLRMIVLFGLVGLGIFNTVTMSILQRRHEFGVLLALGMRPGQLFTVLALETFALSSAGLVLGTGVVLLIVHGWLAHAGLDVESLGAHLPGVLEGARVIYPYVEWDSIAKAGAWALAVPLAVLVAPAWRILRLDPAVAVRSYGAR